MCRWSEGCWWSSRRTSNSSNSVHFDAQHHTEPLNRQIPLAVAELLAADVATGPEHAGHLDRLTMHDAAAWLPVESLLDSLQLSQSCEEWFPGLIEMPGAEVVVDQIARLELPGSRRQCQLERVAYEAPLGMPQCNHFGGPPPSFAASTKGSCIARMASGILEGNFDWAESDEEVFACVNDLERPIGTYLYGRRMYDTMVYWETAHALADQPAVAQDFSEIWRAAIAREIQDISWWRAAGTAGTRMIKRLWQCRCGGKRRGKHRDAA
jgi:hypothetical protein